MKKFKLLVQKKLQPVYLLKLSDLLYRKEVIKLIKTNFDNNCEIFYYSLNDTSLSEIFSRFKSQNLFISKKIIVCNDGDTLSENEKKRLFEFIKKLKKVKHSILIIFFEQKKLNHPLFYEISIPGEKELKQFIMIYFRKNGIKVDESLADFLIENTGMDYNKISLELKKILSFAEGKKEIKIDDIKDLINFSGEQNVFKLFDYFFQHDLDNCLKTYYILRDLNTNINFLINILQKNLIQIAQIKSLIEEEKVKESEISKILGLNYYVAKKLTSIAKKYNKNVIKEMFDNLFDIEIKSKSINIDPYILFENFLIRYLKKCA